MTALRHDHGPSRIGCAPDQAARYRLADLRSFDRGYREGQKAGRRDRTIAWGQIVTVALLALSVGALLAHAADVWGAGRCFG